jgi:VWFA-related protein
MNVQQTNDPRERSGRATFVRHSAFGIHHSIAAVLFAGASLTAASQQPVFRSSTSLVEVDVIVKDRDDRFVSGLTADDFEILEDGKAQPIQHFYLVTQTPNGGGEPKSEVVLPRSPDQMSRRAFVLMLDGDHLSPGYISRVKKAAMDFVTDHLRPLDLAGVYVNGALWNGRLTSHRQELLDGIRSLTPAFETPETRMTPLVDWPRVHSVFDAIRIESGDRALLEDLAHRNCTEEPEHCAREGGREFVEDRLQSKSQRFVDDSRRAANTMAKALSYISRNLARLPGRKTVVMFSEGFFVEDLRTVLPQIAGEAARAGITIYTINARGTENVGGRTFADAAVRDVPDEGLDILSAETGGVSFRHTDNYANALNTVAADTSTYYVLAYSPQNAALDGKFRRIELRTKWNGLKIRARRGYLATPLPSPKAPRIAR